MSLDRREPMTYACGAGQERMMIRKKEMVTLYLEPEQLERLRQVSKETGVPMAIYMRRALVSYMGDQLKPADKAPQD